MLKIPEGIPKDLVDELESCQKQLKILFSNYQILRGRQKANPEDDVIPGQIKQVEQYIIQFNDKQTPIIKKIRKIIKNQENGLNSSKSSDDDTSIKTDDEKPVSEEEILESLGLKHVARTPDGKIDHAKLSMKDRMAIVRGMRKRRKKGAFLIEQEAKKSKITLDGNESNQNEQEDRGIVAEGQYNGFVNTAFEKFHANPPVYDGSDCSAVENRKMETNLKKCSQLQFLANLDLFTPKEVDSVLDIVQTFSRKKINYRNMTYVPEMLDKKQRYYTYLAPDINSPPLLRTRQRKPVNGTGSNTASRLTSRSNSRATTPERSVTRQLSSVSSSNDSNEGNNLANGKKEISEKVALETELSGLKKRSQELQSILGANKRTISTRKERSRISEVSDEAIQLESRITQIKKILVKL